VADSAVPKMRRNVGQRNRETRYRSRFELGEIVFAGYLATIIFEGGVSILDSDPDSLAIPRKNLFGR
jgi:hypothetical protein